MALGRRKREQQEMWVATQLLPRSRGYPFYRAVCFHLSISFAWSTHVGAPGGPARTHDVCLGYGRAGHRSDRAHNPHDLAMRRAPQFRPKRQRRETKIDLQFCRVAVAWARSVSRLADKPARGKASASYGQDAAHRGMGRKVKNQCVPGCFYGHTPGPVPRHGYFGRSALWAFVSPAHYFQFPGVDGGALVSAVAQPGELPTPSGINAGWDQQQFEIGQKIRAVRFAEGDFDLPPAQRHLRPRRRARPRRRVTAGHVSRPPGRRRKAPPTRPPRCDATWFDIAGRRR